MTRIRVLINIVSVFYVGLCITKSLAYANNRSPMDGASQMNIYPYNGWLCVYLLDIIKYLIISIHFFI